MSSDSSSRLLEQPVPLQVCRKRLWYETLLRYCLILPVGLVEAAPITMAQRRITWTFAGLAAPA